MTHEFSGANLTTPVHFEFPRCLVPRLPRRPVTDTNTNTDFQLHRWSLGVTGSIVVRAGFPNDYGVKYGYFSERLWLDDELETVFDPWVEQNVRTGWLGNENISPSSTLETPGMGMVLMSWGAKCGVNTSYARKKPPFSLSPAAASVGG